LRAVPTEPRHPSLAKTTSPRLSVWSLWVLDSYPQAKRAHILASPLVTRSPGSIPCSRLVADESNTRSVLNSLPIQPAGLIATGAVERTSPHNIARCHPARLCYRCRAAPFSCRASPAGDGPTLLAPLVRGRIALAPSPLRQTINGPPARLGVVKCVSIAQEPPPESRSKPAGVVPEWTRNR
jgi:hypothetical protein